MLKVYMRVFHLSLIAKILDTPAVFILEGAFHLVSVRHCKTKMKWSPPDLKILVTPIQLKLREIDFPSGPQWSTRAHNVLQKSILHIFL